MQFNLYTRTIIYCGFSRPIFQWWFSQFCIDLRESHIFCIVFISSIVVCKIDVFAIKLFSIKYIILIFILSADVTAFGMGVSYNWKHRSIWYELFKVFLCHLNCRRRRICMKQAIVFCASKYLCAQFFFRVFSLLLGWFYFRLLLLQTVSSSHTGG